MVARTFSTPVLVVGAGPVGAVLALELAHHGVPSLVVERATAPSAHPKMDYVSGRSMELLRRLGLTAAIRKHGIDPDYSTDILWTQGFDDPPVLVWHQPSVSQMRQRYAAVNDGTAPVEPYQRVQGSVLEELVRDAARAHPLIDLREGWTFTNLRLTADGVEATVVEAASTTRHVIAARFLAGCDGARSTVRRCLDLPLDELGAAMPHCSVYFRSGDPQLRRYGRAFVTTAARGLTLVSRDEQDTWTGSLPISPAEAFTADPIDLVRQRLGLDFKVDQVLHVSQWDASLAVATAYRKGSAFLVGDAAHQFYPTDGYGADTGLADAVDLGWKLAAAIAGWGGPDLLTSYEQERRPVALFNREMCAKLLEVWRRFGRLATAGASREQLAGVLEQEVHQIDNLGVHFGYRHTASPVIWHEGGNGPAWHWRQITATTWPGGRAPAVRLANGTHLFDQLDHGFTLVDLSGQGSGGPLVEEGRARGIPVAHLALNDPSVRACWERDLVLVRPDQYVAWRDDSPPGDWGAVLARVTGQPDTP